MLDQFLDLRSDLDRVLKILNDHVFEILNHEKPTWKIVASGLALSQWHSMSLSGRKFALTKLAIIATGCWQRGKNFRFNRKLSIKGEDEGVGSVKCSRGARILFYRSKEKKKQKKKTRHRGCN